MLAVAAVASAVTVWLLRAPDTLIVPAERRFGLATAGNAAPIDVSISPNGRSMLVVAAGKLWMQRLDQFVATEVQGSDDARAQSAGWFSS